MAEKRFQHCSQLYSPPVEDADLIHPLEGAAMAENYIRRRLQLYNSTILLGLPGGASKQTASSRGSGR